MSDEALRIVEERFAKGEIDLAQRDLLRAKLGDAISPRKLTSQPASKFDESEPAGVSGELPAKPTRSGPSSLPSWQSCWLVLTLLDMPKTGRRKKFLTPSGMRARR